jgi:hypothetical protein
MYRVEIAGAIFLTAEPTLKVHHVRQTVLTDQATRNSCALAVGGYGARWPTAHESVHSERGTNVMTQNHPARYGRRAGTQKKEKKIESRTLPASRGTDGVTTNHAAADYSALLGRLFLFVRSSILDQSATPRVCPLTEITPV